MVFGEVEDMVTCAVFKRKAWTDKINIINYYISICRSSSLLSGLCSSSASATSVVMRTTKVV